MSSNDLDETTPEQLEDSVSEDAPEATDTEQPSETDRLSQLEEEGDIAADYLEELLDIADIDGDIDIEVRNDRTFVSLVGDDDNEELKDLVGKKGNVLDALQELSRLAVLTQTGNRSRLMLDILDFRAERNVELAHIAEDAIAQVKEEGGRVHLNPMSPYERKLVHDLIAEAGLHSESEGEGSRRHIVVSEAN
ncbi:Jag family protein [Micrococcoides hystricis]|uniref:Protein jag n=1 Tax=Micrococcoides hystricis TaxID=1572761 RepID=A0ABV6PDP2_9MICC